METENIRKISDMPAVTGAELDGSEKFLIEKSGHPKNVTMATINRSVIGTAELDASKSEKGATITMQLKDADGKVVSEKIIAVPLETVHSEIDGITALIPSQASEDNQLADKEFVNSTVGTNTANYIYKTDSEGEHVPFGSVDELEAYTGTVTQNDYAFVTGIDENGNVYFDRYKAVVNDGVVSWAKEYRLNNSSFTAEQWSAINSGITSGKIAEIDEAISQIGSTVPEPSTTDKLLISEEVEGDLKWVEIDKDKVGEVTTRCTKEEWNAKPLAERIALAGSAVDITDDYDEVDNNVYSTEETVVGKWIDGKPIYRKAFERRINANEVVATDVKYLINQGGFSEDSSGYGFIPTDVKDTRWMYFKTDRTNHQIIFGCSGNYQNVQGFIEYTKTTD